MKSEIDVRDALANSIAQRDKTIHTGYSVDWLEERIITLRWVLEQGEL